MAYTPDFNSPVDAWMMDHPDVFTTLELMAEINLLYNQAYLYKRTLFHIKGWIQAVRAVEPDWTSNQIADLGKRERVWRERKHAAELAKEEAEEESDEESEEPAPEPAKRPRVTFNPTVEVVNVPDEPPRPLKE